MRINETIYMDYQASTPVDPRVMAAMSGFFTTDFANPHSADHAAGWRSQKAVEESAEKLARLVSADPDEIIFTSGATEANNLVLLGLARRATPGRRRILVSAIEHKCVLAAARAAAQQADVVVGAVPVTPDGLIDTDALENLVNEDVLAVAAMAVNNEIGTIQNLREIGRLCESVGAIFHCDAVQAPLAMRLDVHDLHIGTLSLSAHKLYGPKGIGIAFLRRDLQDRIEPLIYGGGQQRNLRSGTVPTPLCVGFGAAAELLSGSDWTDEFCRTQSLRDEFETRLLGLGNFVSVNGGTVARHPGNLNVCFHGFDAHDLLAAMQPALAASTGSACTSGSPEPSHVLQAIGLEGSEAGACIRFSLGRFSTIEDVEQAAEIVRNVLNDRDIHQAV